MANDPSPSIENPWMTIVVPYSQLKRRGLEHDLYGSGLGCRRIGYRHLGFGPNLDSIGGSGPSARVIGPASMDLGLATGDLILNTKT